MELLGWFTTVMAIAGVLLNNRMDRRCFYFWLISNAISCGLHIAEGMVALSVRDFVFFVLAGYGLKNWARLHKTTNYELRTKNSKLKTKSVSP